MKDPSTPSVGSAGSEKKDEDKESKKESEKEENTKMRPPEKRKPARNNSAKNLDLSDISMEIDSELKSDSKISIASDLKPKSQAVRSNSSISIDSDLKSKSISVASDLKDEKKDDEEVVDADDIKISLAS